MEMKVDRFLYGFCGSKQEEWMKFIWNSILQRIMPFTNCFVKYIYYSIKHLLKPIPLISPRPFYSRTHSSAGLNHVESSWTELSIHKTLPYSPVINAEARVTPIARPDAKKKPNCANWWLILNECMNEPLPNTKQHVQLTHTEQFRHTICERIASHVNKMNAKP